MLKIIQNIFKTEKSISANKSCKPRVYLGMSGGVDSSVSAYLLQQQGYEVIGVFIRVWQPEGSICTWKDERRDAMRVAAHLGIDFITLDLRDAYKKGVVDYMIQEYSQGYIPNPDVMCNREVKFGAFYAWIEEREKDKKDWYIATGHYAQVIDGKLYEGKDKNKDQSYFLWTVSSQVLSKTLFPIGHLQKGDVRSIGEKAGIPVFDKKDSQGVCFIGHIDMKEFLKGYIDVQDGDVLDIFGNIIGRHQGALLYTHGERHAFNLFSQSNTQKKLYVLDKDIEKNTITVGELDDSKKKNQERKGIVLRDIVLRDDIYDPNYLSKKITCRTRYRQEKIKVSSITKGEVLTLTLTEYPVMSEGQSVVLYVDEECIGGGVLM